jgi:hypothetical protein
VEVLVARPAGERAEALAGADGRADSDLAVDVCVDGEEARSIAGNVLDTNRIAGPPGAEATHRSRTEAEHGLAHACSGRVRSEMRLQRCHAVIVVVAVARSEVPVVERPGWDGVRPASHDGMSGHRRCGQQDASERECQGRRRETPRRWPVYGQLEFSTPPEHVLFYPERCAPVKSPKV